MSILDDVEITAAPGELRTAISHLGDRERACLHSITGENVGLRDAIRHLADRERACLHDIHETIDLIDLS